MELKNEVAEEKKQAWIVTANTVDMSKGKTEVILFKECVVGTKTKVKEYLQCLLDEDADAINESVLKRIDAQDMRPDGISAYLKCETVYIDYSAEPIKKAWVLK